MTLVARTQNVRGKMPVSRHPLFPLVVGMWFAALFGLGCLALRPALIEHFVQAWHIDLLIPAAAPPLGITARILLAGMLFVIGGALGFFLARKLGRGAAAKNARFAKPPAPTTDAPTSRARRDHCRFQADFSQCRRNANRRADRIAWRCAIG